MFVMRHAALPFGGSSHCLRCSQTLNCSSASPPALLIVQFKYLVASMLLIGPSQILFAGLLDSMRSESFSRDLRRFDQCGPFVDLALDEFLEIFGRPALGCNQNGAELPQAFLGRRSAHRGDSGIAATVALWSFCTIAAGV